MHRLVAWAQEPAVPTVAVPDPAAGADSVLRRLDPWGDLLLQWSILLGQALLILLIGLWLAKRFAGLARALIERRGGDAVLSSFVRNTVYVLLAVVVLVGALDRAGVPTASMLAALGAAGLAIGLALKDSLSNLASGVLLVITRPFRAGDYVEISGNAGTVERIDLLQTVLATPDNKVIAVPNGLVMGAPIINYTARTERRTDLTVAIAYESDIRRAISTVEQALASRPDLILAEPPVQIVITALADSGVTLSVRAWLKTTEFVSGQSELLALIKQALEAAGIAIPYPQRTLRLVAQDSRPAEAGAAAAPAVRQPPAS